MQALDSVLRAGAAIYDVLPDHNQTARLHAHVKAVAKAAAKVAEKHIRSGSRLAAKKLSGAAGLSPSIVDDHAEAVFVVALLVLGVTTGGIGWIALRRACCPGRHGDDEQNRYAQVHAASYWEEDEEDSSPLRATRVSRAA